MQAEREMPGSYSCRGRRSVGPLLFCILFSFVAGLSHQRARCEEAGIPVCAFSGTQRYPCIAPDGSGGFFVTWEDYRNGTWDIYAQRVAMSGDVLWAVDGIAVCSAAGNQTRPRVMADKSGGAYIVWTDARNGSGTADVYAQRVDSIGGMIGPADGAPVSAAQYSQAAPVMVPDGSGGAIIAWLDTRNETDPYPAIMRIDVYAQRIDSSLAGAWSPNGNLVYSTGWENGWLDMVSDGAGGAVLVWWDYIPEHVYASRITNGGALAWGKRIATFAETPRIASDGVGGAVIAWNDGAIAQRYDAVGGELWTAGGVATGVTGGIASDSSGGAIIGSALAQRIGSNGASLWQVDGVATGVTGAVIADGAGGAIVGGSRVQRIDSDGTILWPPDGLPTGVESGPAMISDGAGGAILAWYDSRNGNSDIFAQRINPLLAPTLDSIGARGIEAGQTLAIQLSATDPSGSAVVTYGTDAGEALLTPFSFDESTGLFLWTPDSSDAGDHTVTFNLRSGMFYDEEAIVISVFINGNRPPILEQPAAAFAYEGYPISISARAVDPDGDPLSYSIDDARYSLHDSVFVWHTSVGDAGTYHCLLTASDGRLSDSATVDATVLTWENASPQRDRMYTASHPYFLWHENNISWHAAEDGYLAGPSDDNDLSAAVVSERAYASLDTCALVFRFFRTSLTRYIIGFTATSPAATDFDTDKIDYGINCDGGGYIRPSWATNIEYWNQAKLPAGIYDVKISLNKMNNSVTFLIDDVASVGDPLSDFASPYWSKVEYRTLVDTCFIQVNVLNDVARIYDIWSVHGSPPVATFLQSRYSVVLENEIAIHWTLSERPREVRFTIFRDIGSSGDYAEIASPRISNEGLAYVMRDPDVEPGTCYRYRVYVPDGEESRLLFETESISIPSMPVTLYGNYPNPFNPLTTIRFYIPRKGRVVLEIYDVQGKRITRLVDGDLDKGFHMTVWNGFDSKRIAVSTGVYFYCLRAGKEMISRKMVLIR